MHIRIVAATILLVSAMSDARAQSWTQVGMLNCTLAPSVGLLVVAQQRMACRFASSAPYPPQNYSGVMTQVGVELGVTAGGVLAWAVFAPTVGPAFAGLAGEYVGASGDVSVGLGLGANVLIGGSERSVALQPLSVEGSAGLNLQLGISNLQLMAVP